MPTRASGGGAYVLLTLAAVFWAGNAVAGKLATGVLTPAALTFLRWLIATVVLGLVGFRQLRTDRARMRASATRIFVLGAVGYFGFALSLYSALH